MWRLSNAVKALGSKVNGKEPEGKGLSETIESFANDYRLEVANMTTLTNEQCERLVCGEVIVKNDSTGKHAYIVSFKKDKVGLCLTYTDAETVETVSYDYTSPNWVYNSTDITRIASN